MEREAKYRATKRIRPTEIEALDLAPYSLGERQTADLRDTILDTADRRLSQARYGLRVRHDGEQLLLTLKSPGTVSGAVHSRPEIEEPITGRVRDDRTQWPDSIAAPVAELIGDAELAPLIEVRNRRRTWYVTRDGVNLAEIALDRGTISADGRSMPFHEIEIELKGEGSDSDLSAIEARLTAGLPLAPETRSKMQRGLQLHDHNEHRDSIKAAIDRTPMSRNADLAEAGRSILARHLFKLHEAWPVAQAGDDPEGVHEMRVSTRRLRATLAALGEAVYEDRMVRKLRRGLRRWAAGLGEVRDADVFLQTLDTYAAGLAPGVAEQLRPLRDIVLARRESGREQLLDLLDGKKTTALARALDHFVLTEGHGVRNESGEEGQAARRLVRDWAGSLLWSHYERVRAYEPVLGAEAYATLHHVRIEVKHLRYTLELFRDALGEDAEVLHEQLVAVQDHLGSLQDAVVAIELVDEALLEHPENMLLHTYRAEQVSKRDRLAGGAAAVVGTILAQPFRRKLATLIAKL
jgi:triphosphatase